ncbi:MAG: hypothetical protein ACJAWL_001540 [Motiliproteus sp.]|jgi:hypothetical protein
MMRKRYLKSAVHPLGFSMLQILVSCMLIMVVATISFRQYMSIAEDAERAAFNRVRGWLQTGVNLAMVDVLSPSDLTKFEDSNPMPLLERVMSPPGNYLGELRGAAAADAQSGNWYFDLDQGALYYRFRFNQASTGLDQAENERLGFRLTTAGPTESAASSMQLIQISGP